MLARLLVLAGLASMLGRAADRGRQVPRPGVAALIWLLGIFLVGMVLLGGLLTVVIGALANLGPGFVVCLAPLAILVAIGLGAYRLRQQSRASEARPAETATGQATPASAADRTDSATSPAPAARAEAPPAAVAREVPQARKQEKPRAVAREAPPVQPAVYRQRATAYRRRIQSIIKSRRPGPLASVMGSVLANVERWEQRVGQLADRLAAFEGDSIIQRDIKEVPANIARMEGLVAREADTEMRDQMERTLEGYRQQQAQLDALVRLMRRTRLQLDDTVASMGIIYSQVQMVDAMEVDSSRAARIAEEIDEQVARLNDLLSAMTDVDAEPEQVEQAARRIRLERGGTSE